MNRNLFLLLQGQFVSQIGTQLAQIATIFWLTAATGSPAVIGGFMAACALPPLLLAPLGGVCVDIFPKKTVIVLCDALSGVAVLSLACISQSSFHNSQLFVITLFAVNILLASLNAFFLPGVNALVPQLAAAEKMHLAVSWFQTVSMASLVIGQAIAGILLGWQTPRFLYFVDGLSYFFTSAFESRIRVPQGAEDSAPAVGDVEAGLFRASGEGLRYVRRHPELKRLFVAALPLNVLMSPVWVFLPFYTTTVVGKPENWYGYFLAAFCLGLLSGYLLPTLSKSSVRAASGIMVVSVSALPALILGLALFRSAPYTLAALALMGLSTGLISVFGVIVIQKLTGSEAQGRVMGLLIMITQGLAPLIGSFAGFITGKTANDIRTMYAACAALMLVSSVAFLARRASRQLFHGLAEDAAV